MDIKTFGDSRAAVVLAQLLIESNAPALQRKVTRVLVSFNTAAIEIEDNINNIRVARVLYRLLLEDSEKKMAVISSGKVMTFAVNLLHGRYKAWLRTPT